MKNVLTLCFIQKDDHMLLGKKKRGFGEGNWNGFGGKLEPGESVEDGAKRELWEECGVTASDMEKRGVIFFSFENLPDELEVHVFSVSRWMGEPQETEEMAPAWFSVAALPFEQMWADDPYWMPLFLAGKKFSGRFHFQDTNTLLSHELWEL